MEDRRGAAAGVVATAAGGAEGDRRPRQFAARHRRRGAGPGTPGRVDRRSACADDDSDLPDAIAPSWKAPTSGGSTGRPKLIVAGQPGVVMEVAALRWRITPGDIVLMPGPLYHNGPIVTAFPALMVGAPLVVMPKFDAEETLRADREASHHLGLSRADDDEPHLAPAGRDARRNTISPRSRRCGISPRRARPG